MPIEPSKLYPLNEFREATGFSESAMRAARRAGLVVRYVHKRAFVIGEDFIVYVKTSGKASANGK